MTLNDWLGIYFCSFSSSQPPSPLPLPHFGTLLLLLYPDPGSEILGFAKLRKREYLKLKREGTGGRKGSLPSVFPPQPFFSQITRLYFGVPIYTYASTPHYLRVWNPPPFYLLTGVKLKSCMHVILIFATCIYWPSYLLAEKKKNVIHQLFSYWKLTNKRMFPPRFHLKF